jgi:hypothetical protein
VPLVKAGDWIINTRYIQYATMAPGGFVVTFGEGPSTKTANLTPEQWNELKQNIARAEAGPPRA